MKQRFKVMVPQRTVGYGEKAKVLPAFLASVEVSIDIERIAVELGTRAARSKGKRAGIGNGMVKVKAVPA